MGISQSPTDLFPQKLGNSGKRQRKGLWKDLILWANRQPAGDLFWEKGTPQRCSGWNTELTFLLFLPWSSAHFMYWMTVKLNKKKKRQSQTLPHTYDCTQWKAVMQTLSMRSSLCLGVMPPCELQLAAGTAVQHLSHVSLCLAAVKVRLLQSYPYLGHFNRARKVPLLL